MKQYVKALPKDRETFKYLCTKFPNLSDAKLKEEIFTGPDTRKITKDTHFERVITYLECLARMLFIDVIAKFLGNVRDPNCKEIVREMLSSYKHLGCNMSLKIHFLNSHIEYFQTNLWDYSEEHGECFHQDLKDVERRYQGRWDIRMMADYCCMIHRDDTEKMYKQKATKQSFR
ncbi:hypothetical protein PR048_013665 [Dryococelus australis]|uniref:Uncharacterized protein n=1 Tax=Dryococelus australis TaxID=614101 RepID=A0ABQ9HT47_9NEOP|nr:hypothetical protein PR048_013665 [Dryococelus australis]